MERGVGGLVARMTPALGIPALAIPALLALCALVLAPALPRAGEAAAQPTGGIRGVVVDARSGIPLPGMQVSVEPEAGAAGGALLRAGVTDSAGRFAFAALPPARYLVRVRSLGFAPSVSFVRVEHAVLDLRIEAASLAVTLETVRARARAAERDRFEARPNVGVLRVTRRALASVPAVGEADVLRAVQLLPGVAARNDFTAGYNVRGGEADQNLVLLDGHPIYNPFHLGGLFGTFIDEGVSDIQLLTGGFNARYGGRLSSVLDVRSARPEREGVHGAAGVSLLASHAMAGSVRRDRRAGWTVAARRTYADKLASLFTSQSLPYHFVDAQLHGWHAVGAAGELALTAYAGRDLLDGSFAQLGDSASSGGGDFRFNWGNTLLGATLRYPTHTFGDSGRVELRVSDSRFSTALDLGSGSLLLRNHVAEQQLQATVRGGSERRIWRVGGLATHVGTTYDAQSRQMDAALFRLAQSPWTLGGFAEGTWRPTRRLMLEGGGRVEGVSGTGWIGVSPRASAKLFLNRDLALTLAAGRYTQWMHSLAREDIPVRIFDFWVASDRGIPVSRADHFMAGIEQWLSPTRFVRVEGYFKHYPRLLDANPTNDPTRRGDEFLPQTGRSFGVDLMAQQLEAGPFSGWVAYSFSVAQRTTGSLRYYPGHDRRHNMNVVASWHTGAGYVVSSRLGLATGTPYTDIVGQLVRRSYDVGRNRWDTAVSTRSLEPIGGPRNGVRLPFFQRLDASVTRRIPWRGATLVPFISVVNVYNARNVFTYTFDYTTNPPTRTSLSQFPVLPALGLTVEF
ncbi:MAG: TonB-dependent receptor [Gemmatimonadaceae bacterium]